MSQAVPKSIAPPQTGSDATLIRSYNGSKSTPGERVAEALTAGMRPWKAVRWITMREPALGLLGGRPLPREGSAALALLDLLPSRSKIKKAHSIVVEAISTPARGDDCLVFLAALPCFSGGRSEERVAGLAFQITEEANFQSWCGPACFAGSYVASRQTEFPPTMARIQPEIQLAQSLFIGFAAKATKLCDSRQDLWWIAIDADCAKYEDAVAAGDFPSKNTSDDPESWF